LVFVAYEGVVTEPKYFQLLAEKLRANSKTSVRLFAVDRPKRDGKSHPEHVKQGIEEFYKEQVAGRFDPTRDQLWIVVDVDQHFKAKPGITAKAIFDAFLNSLSTFDGIVIHAAISNPSFELWEILHLKTAQELDIPLLLANAKVNSEKTYSKKLLSDLMSSRSPRMTVHSLLPLVETAVQNAKSELLSQDNYNLFSSAGTTVFHLVENLLD